MIVRKLTLVVGCSLACWSHQLVSSVVKQDQEVFTQWIDWQEIFSDSSCAELCGQNSPTFWPSVEKKLTKHKELLKPLVPFLTRVTGATIDCSGSKPVIKTVGKNNVKQVCLWLDNDIKAMLKYVQKNRFINQAVNKSEQSIDVEETIKKNKILLKMLLHNPDKKERNQAIFAAANHMFEYCFSPKTYPEFERLLNNPLQHQIARFCYSTMWTFLVGEGWKHWHEECLLGLKREADRGMEIVYVAGGNDIYQLLLNGIYNIRVIDPMLPSQNTYYAQGWSWLVKQASAKDIGDVVMVNDGEKNIVLRRASYKEHGTFQVHLSTGQDAVLPLSTTTWQVLDGQTKKKLGSVVFERRFCAASDFIRKANQIHLLSLCEMYFVAMPPQLLGWGIGAQALPENFYAYIKQLRRPINKKIVANMRKAEDSKFSFIMLGSSTT